MLTSPIALTAEERDHIIAKGKRVVAGMHLLATHLMENYGDPCSRTEYDAELNTTLIFGIYSPNDELNRIGQVELSLGRAHRFCR